MRGYYKDIQIVDLVKTGEYKSPLPPFKKGEFKKPASPSPPFLKGDLGGFDKRNSLA